MRVKTCSESELVVRAGSDVECMGELVERYRGSITRQCHGRVRDWHLAEDLAQETFVRAYQKLCQLREPSLFPNWLRRIASNICNEFLRSPVRLESAWESPPERTVLERSALAARDLLETLPDGIRVCAALYYEDGLSYAEVAHELGITEAAVRNRLHRARVALREEMAEMAQVRGRTFTRRVLDKLQALESGDVSERARAAGELRKSVDEDHFQTVLDVLTGLSHDYFLDAAISVSKRYPCAQMRDALISITSSHADEGARIKAAGALVAQKDPSAIPYLRKVLDRPGEDRDVAAAAKSAIAQLERMELPAPPDFEELRLRRDMEDAAKDRAARLELVKRLTGALSDPSGAVRNRVLKTLARLGDRRAARAVAKLLDDPVHGIREAAAMALGEIGGKVARDALARVVASDPLLRRAALNALAKCGDASAVPAVLKAIEESPGDNNIFHFCTVCLERIASPDDLAAIKETMLGFVPSRGDQGLWVNRAWARVLAAHADKRHLPDLKEALAAVPGDNDLVEAVWRVAGSDAFEILREQTLLHGSHRATDLLARLGEQGLAALKEAIRSERQSARSAAYWALRTYGYELVRGSGGPDTARCAIRPNAPELVRHVENQGMVEAVREAERGETGTAKLVAKAALHSLLKLQREAPGAK